MTRCNLILMDPDPGQNAGGTATVTPPPGPPPGIPPATPPAQPPAVDWGVLAPFIKDGKIELTVGGEKKQVGPSEMVALLQKDLAGDSKLRKAADQTKQAETARQFHDDALAAKRGDPEAYGRVAHILGIDPNVAADLMDFGAEGEGDTDAGAPQPQFDPEIEDMKKFVQAQKLEKIRTDIFGDARKGLDSDPRFQVLLKGTDKQRAAVWNLVHSAVRRHVGLDGFEWGPELRGKVLDEIHTTLRELGILDEADRLGIPPSPTGMGRSPGLAGSVVHQPPKAMERPDANSPKYEDYVINTMQRQAMAMADAGA